MDRGGQKGEDRRADGIMIGTLDRITGLDAESGTPAIAKRCAGGLNLLLSETHFVKCKIYTADMLAGDAEIFKETRRDAEEPDCYKALIWMLPQDTATGSLIPSIMSVAEQEPLMYSERETASRTFRERNAISSRDKTLRANSDGTRPPCSQTVQEKHFESRGCLAGCVSRGMDASAGR